MLLIMLYTFIMHSVVLLVLAGSSATCLAGICSVLLAIKQNRSGIV